jgi:hypothetical protein
VAERQTSLNFRRRLLHRVWRRQGRVYGPGPFGLPSDEYIRRTLHCDPDSLKRAAEFFGLHPYGLDPTVESDVFLLALLLAEELFGKRRRGRKPGNKAWDERRLLELAHLYEELKREWPRASDTEIAEVISREPEFKEYRSNPDLIRKRLPEAKRRLMAWWEENGPDMLADYLADQADYLADQADDDDHDDLSP